MYTGRQKRARQRRLRGQQTPISARRPPFIPYHPETRAPSFSVAPSASQMYFSHILSLSSTGWPLQNFFNIREVCVRGRCDIIRLTEIAQIKCATLAASARERAPAKPLKREMMRGRKRRKVPPRHQQNILRRARCGLRQTPKWSRCQFFCSNLALAANYITWPRP